MNSAHRVRASLSIFAAVVVAAICAACGSTASSTTTTKASSTTALQTLRISLDFYANVDYLGIYAAINNGYFAAEHIKPVIIPYSGTPAETLLQAGKTDLGMTYPPNIPANRASGLKYRAVAGVTQINTIELAVLASSGIKNVAQLSGKLYGGFGTPSDPAIITAIMKKAGVKNPVFNQVTLTTAAYQALAAKRVAYTTMFGGIDDVTAELQGAKLRLFPDKDYLGATMSFPDDAFVATDAEIDHNANLLRRGLKALSEGYTFAAQHPAAAEAILIKDNETALAHSKNIVVATGNATAPTFLSGGTWGRMSSSMFAGVTTLLKSYGTIKGTPPPASDDFTNSLLPSS